MSKYLDLTIDELRTVFKTTKDPEEAKVISKLISERIGNEIATLRERDSAIRAIMSKHYSNSILQ